MRHGIGGMNYDHVFLKIARPVRCKCFDRDVSVCTELNRRLSDSGQRALFLVVSSWDDQQRENEIWNWFRLLYDRRNDLSNIDFYVINDFNWPGKSLEERNKLRSKLFWACDVSFSQSSYESFGIAQLEPLAFGSICIISAVSGAAEILHQHLGSELYQNHPSIVLADYTGDNNPVGDNIRKIAVNVFKYDTAELEHQTAVGVATEVWRQLEAQKMDEQIDERWKAGADAAAAFDEEKFAREFVRVVTSTDQQDERPEYQSATEPSNDDAEAA
jgi:glycosyltransferase involved in cell wall biosynthesis